MTDRPYYEERQAVMLRTWVLGQMMRGAMYGLAFAAAIGAFLGVVWVVSCLLPAASKEAPPPMSWVIAAPAEVRPA